MGLKVLQYSVAVCTECWNNDFDIGCKNCDELGYKRCYVQRPIIQCTFNNLRSYTDQLEEFKKEFYKNYTIEQITQ